MERIDRQQRRERAIAKRQSWELPHTFIIEMDGALVDDLTILYDAYMSFLEKQGFAGSRAEFHELLGLPLPEFLYQLCDKHGLRKSQQDLLKTYETFLSETYTPNMSLLPHASDSLEEAYQLGITLALVAPITHHLVRSYWSGKELGSLFEKIITPEISETLPSERSNPYHRALIELGTESEDVIAIVQSSHARESAQEAGMTVWCFALQVKEKQKLKAEPHTTSFFENWNKILNFLQNRYDYSQ